MTISRAPANRTILRCLLGFGLLCAAALQPSSAPAADLQPWKAERRAAHDHYGPHYRHHRHHRYYRYYREYDECRTGWWRARWHLGIRRPAWATRCR